MCFSSRKLSSLLSQGWLLETIRADEFLGGEQRCHGGYDDSPGIYGCGRRSFKVAACKWLWATLCYAFFAMLVTIVRSGIYIYITFAFVKWHCRRIIIKLYRNDLLNFRSSVTEFKETLYVATNPNHFGHDSNPEKIQHLSELANFELSINGNVISLGSCTYRNSNFPEPNVLCR